MAENLAKRMCLAAVCVLAGMAGALPFVGWARAGVSPSAPGVEIGPNRTREAGAGQVVTYSHTLTNTGTTSDTFGLEVLSSQGWSVALLAPSHPTPTSDLILSAGPELTASFLVSLTVPIGASGVTDATTVTATSQLSPAVQATVVDTTIVRFRAQFPLVLSNWPPLPHEPALSAISNSDGNGFYNVSWASAENAETYSLEEDDNSGFSSPTEVYNGAGTSWPVPGPGKTAGNFYYRVRGHNTWGYGGYSNSEAVTVLLPGTPTLNPIDNTGGDGNYAVTWNTTARATSYLLQEDTDPGFGSPTTVHGGSQTWWSASGRTAGTYYYRAQASGPTGQSSWSSTQGVAVLPPETPFLNPIDNSDGDGSYWVTWTAAARATSYALLEAPNPDGTGAVTVYVGPGLSWLASGKASGTYYYRAMASGPTGVSGQSNIQSTVVLSFEQLIDILDGNSILVSLDYLTYLGEVSSNCYAADSIVNPFGAYGSTFSMTSISNPLGPYGSPFSLTSAYNALATQPPRILWWNGQEFVWVFYLSVNTVQYPRVDTAAMMAYLRWKGGCAAP